MIYTVSENVEIILDGKRYLLEAGDQIIVEAVNIALEREFKDIADKVDENFDFSFDDIGLIEEGLFASINNFDDIKKFVKNEIKSRKIRVRVDNNLVGDILNLVIENKTQKDWRNAEVPLKTKAERDQFRKWDKERGI